MQRVDTLDGMTDLVEHALAIDHHHYEKMARAVTGYARLSCWTGQRLDDRFRQHLPVAVYRPNQSKPPVVAFGNTRINAPDVTSPASLLAYRRAHDDMLDDIRADFFPMGIGFFRYCYNEGTLKRLLEQLVRDYGQRVIVTGHSLGGAIAQLAALRLTEYIGGCVTFQSPKSTLQQIQRFYDTIPQDIIDDLAASTFHYNVDGDALVQQAGEQESPGQLIKLVYKSGEIDSPSVLYSHIKEIFPDFIPTRGSRRAIRETVFRTFDHFEFDRRGNPQEHARTFENEAIEWFRSNGHLILAAVPALVATAASGARGGIEVSRQLGVFDVLQNTIYSAIWATNITEFRAAPNRHVLFSYFEIPLPFEVSFSSSEVVTDVMQNRMRLEFRRYIQYSRIR